MGRLGNRIYGAKRDRGEGDIVTSLEAIGATVWRKLEVDLLIWLPVYGQFLLPMEVKAPGEKLIPRPGPQQEFCELTGCPIVNDPLEAVRIAMMRRK